MHGARYASRSDDVTLPRHAAKYLVRAVQLELTTFCHMQCDKVVRITITQPKQHAGTLLASLRQAQRKKACPNPLRPRPKTWLHRLLEIKAKMGHVSKDLKYIRNRVSDLPKTTSQNEADVPLVPPWLPGPNEKALEPLDYDRLGPGPVLDFGQNGFKCRKELFAPKQDDGDFALLSSSGSGAPHEDDAALLSAPPLFPQVNAGDADDDDDDDDDENNKKKRRMRYCSNCGQPNHYYKCCPNPPNPEAVRLNRLMQEQRRRQRLKHRRTSSRARDEEKDRNANVAYSQSSA